MHKAAFSTETPLAHLPRALDELRRIECELLDLSVLRHAAHSEIRLEVSTPAKISFDCLLARLERIPGLFDLRADPQPRISEGV